MQLSHIAKSQLIDLMIVYLDTSDATARDWVLPFCRRGDQGAMWQLSIDCYILKFGCHF